MKKNFTYLASLLFLSFAALLPAQAQQVKPAFTSKFAWTGSLGLSAMNSDNHTLGYKNLGLLKGNGYGVHAGVGTHFQFSPYFALQGDVNYNRFNGHQDLGESKGDESSFSYKSDVVNTSASLVFNLASKATLQKFYSSTADTLSNGSGVNNFLRVIMNNTVVVPYIKAGVGLLFATAGSSANGQNDPASVKYPTFAAAIPVGAGVTFRLSNQVSVAPEATCNLTTSDYLDNRKMGGGSMGQNDVYCTGAIKVFYTPGAFKRR